MLLRHFGLKKFPPS